MIDDKDDRRPELEAILDALVESYSEPAIINNLETYALPNKRSVIQGFHHLQHMLFLGFFSTRKLREEVLRMALAEHLLPAHDLLAEQINRAASWEDRVKPLDARRPQGWCKKTVSELFAKLPSLRHQLHGDIQAAYEHDPAASSIEEVVFSYPGVIALTAHRVAHELYQAGVPMIPRILSEYAHERTGIDIHPGAKIGERLFIDHGTGLVVGATSEIGDDVKLYQNVTLGALSVSNLDPKDVDCRRKRHPTLENNVTVYAGATILGGDTIVGEGSVVGGNVWLVKSVPPNSKIYHRPTQG